MAGAAAEPSCIDRVVLPEPAVALLYASAAMEAATIRATATHPSAQRRALAGWVAVGAAGGGIGSVLAALVVVATDGAVFEGLPVGLFLAPGLLLLAVATLRAAVGRDLPLFLVLVGAAWLLASQFDQHVTETVDVSGLIPQLANHGAGVALLWVGAWSFLSRRP